MITKKDGSVALVVLDTLRADRFRSEFDWLPGLHFERAYSTSHWTVPAHASLLTGRYPIEVGVTPKSLDIDGEELVTHELSKQGGQAAHLSTNPQTIYHEGWNTGYETVVTPWELVYGGEDLYNWQEFMRSAEQSGFGRYIEGIFNCLRDDCETLRSLKLGYDIALGSGLVPNVSDSGARRLVETVEQGYIDDVDFAYLNLMEVHTPYHCTVGGRSDRINVTTAEGFAKEISNPEELKRAYDYSVSYLSKTYKQLFSLLTDRFDYIITLADHGELLGEHGHWNHGFGVYPELVEVPLVISGSDVPDSHDNTPVSLLDVHRSISELLALETDSRGRDLLGDLSTANQPPIICSFRGFLPWHKRQFERHGVGDMYEKYDTPLFGVATPGGYSWQTAGGVESIGEDALVEGQIEDVLEDMDVGPAVTGKTNDVSDVVLSQLEDLGYA